MGGRSTSGERCSRTPTNTARPAVPPRPCRPTVRLRVTRRQSWGQPHKSRHCVHWRLRTHRRRHHRLRVSPSTGRRSAARAGRRRARGEAGPCGHHERVTQSARYKRPRTGQAPGPPGTTSAGSPRGLPEVAQWTRFHPQPGIGLAAGLGASPPMTWWWVALLASWASSPARV
jgi:hypothetical protein